MQLNGNAEDNRFSFMSLDGFGALIANAGNTFVPVKTSGIIF
jgi:hypothetical protein